MEPFRRSVLALALACALLPGSALAASRPVAATGLKRHGGALRATAFVTALGASLALSGCGSPFDIRQLIVNKATDAAATTQVAENVPGLPLGLQLAGAAAGIAARGGVMGAVVAGGTGFAMGVLGQSPYTLNLHPKGPDGQVIAEAIVTDKINHSVILTWGLNWTPQETAALLTYAKNHHATQVSNTDVKPVRVKLAAAGGPQT